MQNVQKKKTYVILTEIFVKKIVLDIFFYS